MESFFQYLQLPLCLLGITAIEAMGLQLILGGAGLLTLGHTAFFAIGGYASAAFVTLLAPRWGITDSGLLLSVGVLFALFFSGLTAFLVGIPCLRLRGDYLAVATMGLGQIVENILNNIPQFGGASGFTNIAHLTHLGLILLLVFLCAGFLRRFYETGVGYSILCSRDDETVAQCFGISPERSKLTAWVTGNMMTGLAGALYVHTFQFISPVGAGFQKSVEVLLAVVIGGMFSVRGAFMGATILVLIPELLRYIPHGWIDGMDHAMSAFLPAKFSHLVTGFAQNSMLLFSLIVLVILKINPSGISSIFSSLRKDKNEVSA